MSSLTTGSSGDCPSTVHTSLLAKREIRHASQRQSSTSSTRFRACTASTTTARSRSTTFRNSWESSPCPCAAALRANQCPERTSRCWSWPASSPSSGCSGCAAEQDALPSTSTWWSADWWGRWRSASSGPLRSGSPSAGHSRRCPHSARPLGAGPADPRVEDVSRKQRSPFVLACPHRDREPGPGLSGAQQN